MTPKRIPYESVNQWTVGLLKIISQLKDYRLFNKWVYDDADFPYNV